MTDDTYVESTGAAAGVRHDVFIAHAAEDAEWAAGYLIPALQDAGIRTATVDSYPLGTPKLEAASLGVQESAYVVVLLSPAFLTDHFNEFVALLAQHLGHEERRWRVVPIVVRALQSMPAGFGVLNPLDATTPETRRESLRRLSDMLGRPVPPRPPPPACPYPGMSAYDVDSGKTYPFYGRADEIDEALRRLRVNGWLVVVGPSGCGKSSMVRAGVLARLKEGGHEVVMLRPGQRPVESLTRGLASVQTAVDSGRKVVMLIDQLEELFTAAESTADALHPPDRADHVEEFWRRLEPLRGQPQVWLIATVRADFYPQLMASPMWPLVQHLRMEIVPLRGDRLRTAIRIPAELAEVYIETALVERLVGDSHGQPGALPFVQETLVLLWDKLEYRLLPVSAYEALVLPAERYGEDPRTGLQVAMAERADAVMAQLPDDASRALARRSLLRLVQFVDGRQDVRRQQTLDDLLDSTDDADAVPGVLRHLVKSHLVTATGGEDSGVTRYDLSHEALIAGWPTLRGWVEQRRGAENTRRVLVSVAARWAGHGRAETGLLDEVELREAERWLDSADARELGIGDDVVALIRASRESLSRARLRQRRINLALRSLTVALAVLLVVAVAGALVALQQRNRAERAREAALSVALAATAASLPAEFLDRALLLASESVRLDVSTRSRGSLLAALGSNPRILRMSAGDAPFSTVAASADGALLALGDTAGRARVVETASGTPVGDPVSVPGEVRSLAFSPDGTTFATASSTGEIRQWNVRSGAPVGSALSEHDGAARVVRYSPDGRWLASGGDDALVVLHALEPADIDKVLRGHADWVQALAFTPDGRTLVSGAGATEHRSTDRRILVWDVESGGSLRTLSGHTDAVRALSVAPDGHTVASAAADETVRLWDLRTGSATHVLRGHAERVFDVAFSPTGTWLASAGRDHDIRLWDPVTGESLGDPLRGHTDAVRAIAALPDGGLVSVGTDVRLVVWAPTESGSTRLAGPWGTGTTPVRAAAVDPAGTMVATGDDTGLVEIRRAGTATGPQVVRLRVDKPVSDLAFGADGELVTATHAGELAVWDGRSGRRLAGPVTTPDGATVVAVSPDGQQIASGGVAGVVRLWNLDLEPSGEPLSGHDNWVVELDFRPQDGALFSVGADGVLRRWQRAGSEAWDGVRLSQPAGTMTAMAVAPDGETVATGDRDGGIVLWDADTAEARRLDRQILSVHRAPVTAITYTVSEGAPVLVSTDETGIVLLWDAVGSYELLGRLGSTSGAWSAAGIPESEQVVTGSSSGALTWALGLDAWRRRACAVAGRDLSPAEREEYLGSRDGAPTCPQQTSQPRARGSVRVVAANVGHVVGQSLDVVATTDAGPAVDTAMPGTYGPVASRRPAIVMVHGCCGDRADLAGLAEATAATGAVVFVADWGGLQPGVDIRTGYENVACAVRYARATAAGFGADPSSVTLLGWSDGALAAAVVALAGDRLDASRCTTQTSGPAVPDALVGVAGFYGWSLPVDPRYVTEETNTLLRGPPSQLPEVWEQATPYGWLGQGGPRCTILLAGHTDPLMDDATRFATALRAHGHRVRVVEVVEAGDQTLISPRTAEGRSTVMQTMSAAGCARRS